jgi:hypothetical protein
MFEFEKVRDPQVERWLKSNDPTINDAERIINLYSSLPNFCRLYSKWRQLNHHLYYYACMLSIQGKICHVCQAPSLSLLS